MTGEPAAGSRRARTRPIDWHKGAELLARGVSVAAAAKQIGCAPATLSRRRRQDPEFRQWLEELRPPRYEGQDDGECLAGLRRMLHGAIEAEVRAGNVRVILWLADRLRLVTPIDARTPEQELRQLLGGLSQDELREFEALRDPPPA